MRPPCRTSPKGQSNPLNEELQDMAFPPNYVVSRNIEEVFLFNGLPIVSGWLFAYSAINPTTPKSIYSQNAEPAIVALPNPTEIINGKLSDGVGSNTVAVYNVLDAEGNPELYHLVVRLNDNILGPEFGALVETRDNWPVNGDASAESLVHTENFVTNGQFRWNTVPSEPDAGLTGIITQPVTPVAAGGWFFVRDDTSTATDRVTFPRNPSYVSDPTQSPRYSVRVENLAPDATDLIKDLSYRWNDVNKFSSDTQTYTYSFVAQTTSGSVEVGIYIEKNFGTGGTVSPPQRILKDTITVTTTPTVFNVPFIFGTTDGETIGTNDDDYIAINFGLPTDSAFNFESTNVGLFEGDVLVSEYPITTSRDFLNRSLPNDEEPLNNYNLYLKYIRTQKGLEFDYSEIGRVEARVLNALPFSAFDTDSNLVLCNGDSYKVDSFSPLGVPMRRLWETSIFNPIVASNSFGNGPLFVEVGSRINIPSDFMSISANQLGDTLVQDDGGNPTNFVFQPVSTGNSNALLLSYAGVLYRNPSVPQLPIIGIFGVPYYIATTAINSPLAGSIPGTALYVKTLLGIPSFFYSFSANVTPAWASTYIQFYNAANMPYYVWCRVNGVGVDPTPGGTGFRVDLIDGYPAWLAASLIAQVIRGNSAYVVQCTAGGAIAAGSAFLFDTFAGAGNWYVWYTVDGAGSDPAIVGRSGIQVDVLSTDTSTDVAAKTVTALNSVYYATPDYRGMILRGAGDQYAIEDFIMTPSGADGREISSYIEWQGFASHHHMYLQTSVFVTQRQTAGAVTFAPNSPANANTTDTGGNSTRPTTSAVYYYIRY